MKKVKFVFGIHNHQPIGNFDFIFEEAYQKSYLPFIEILKKHPGIRISIHYTGILLDWLEANHPELLSMIREMTKNGQLEVMSGAYYEPIISVIPQKDRIGQIRKLTSRVKSLFDYDAVGMWLAERIWEPTLPSPLYDAGIKYSVVDDTHFKSAGLTDKDLTGYFISEDLGKMVSLFPISKRLRYTIPFQPPEETINYLKNMATEDGQNVIVFADDGEKFGVWPGTYNHVFENEWLDRFFTILEENMDWIEMLHFDEALEKVLPKNKIYLPTASYAEMMHWSLFPEAFRKYEHFEHYLKDKNMYDDVGVFVRGGFWRNFMTKYPEVNNMHKKMLRVSNKLWDAPEKFKKKLAPAFEQLWAGQCNCPYWHGVFGGLYLSHLRQAIYYSLLSAEKIYDRVCCPDYPIVEITDFDVDGYSEVLVETAAHNAYFKPGCGAVMFEYDFKAVGKNLLDTITRREEGYHHKLKDAKIVGEQSASGGDGTASIHDLVMAKEPGLLNHLNYDWYERKSFIDHFIGHSAAIENFVKAQYKEDGNFVNQPYNLKNKIKDKDKVVLSFVRDGNVWVDDQWRPVTIEKVITILNDAADIYAEYSLINKSGVKLNLNFAVEFNFGMQAGHTDDRYYYNHDGRLDDSYLDSKGILNETKFIGIRDEHLKIDINLETENTASIWRVPVETISLSESGFEKVYQNSAVLLLWKVELDDKWATKIYHRVSTF